MDLFQFLCDWALRLSTENNEVPPDAFRLALARKYQRAKRHGLSWNRSVVEPLIEKALIQNSGYDPEKQRGGFVVLFGSALRPGSVPRDVDVVHGGDCSAREAEELARWWAVEHGLPETVSVDAHEIPASPRIALPVPVGLEPRSLILWGEVEIVYERLDGFPALLRLAEFKPEEALQRIERGVYMGISSPEEVHSGYASQGAQALGSALRHVSSEFCDRLGQLGVCLERIKSLGVEWQNSLRPEAVAAIERHSSAGFGRLVWMRRNGCWTVGFQHGNRPDFQSVEDLLNFLFG